MKNNSKERLFEVMGRLDKTFKPTLNEGFEEIEATDDMAIPAELGAEEVPAEEPVEEKSPEEKLQELTAKVDELYALIHGESEEEIPAEEPEGISIDTGEVEPQNLQEWNFDKKKGEKKDDKEEKKGDKEEKKDDDETEVEVKVEVDESEEAKSKVPVAPIAEVGK